MASSEVLGTSNPYVKYRIDVSPGSGNVAGNYTPVAVSVFVYRTNTGYTTWGTGTIWCKINGTTYSAGIASSQKITEAGIVLFSTTVNIPHNADGTKTLSVTAWLSIPGASLSSSEQGFNTVLTTIPRATVPSLSPASQVMGGTISISLPRAADSFTHKVTYKFGTKTGTIATAAGKSASFVIPETLVEEVTTSVSGTGTITVDTYNGTSLIGSKKVDFTAKVPETVVPSIASVTVAEDVEGIAEMFGTFVQNRSKFRVITEAAGGMGSTISSYAVEVLGIAYSGKEAVTNEITESGAVEVKVTVKDSRGRTAVYTDNVEVTEYETPTITEFSVIRTKADGTEDPEGEYACCDVGFAVSPIGNQNVKNYKIEYKKNGEETWESIKSGSVYTYNGTILSSSAVLSSDYAYKVRLTVEDYFTGVAAEVNLGTGAPLLDFRYTGKGMAVGKVSERDCLEVAMDAEFQKKVLLRLDNEMVLDLLDVLPVPVGSVFYTEKRYETDPSEDYPWTTWKAVKGRTIVGVNEEDADFGEAGKTGGEKKHTLSENEMPAHNHGRSSNHNAVPVRLWLASGKDLFQIGSVIGGVAKTNLPRPQLNKTSIKPDNLPGHIGGTVYEIHDKFSDFLRHAESSGRNFVCKCSFFFCI